MREQVREGGREKDVTNMNTSKQRGHTVYSTYLHQIQDFTIEVMEREGITFGHSHDVIISVLEELVTQSLVLPLTL